MRVKRSYKNEVYLAYADTCDWYGVELFLIGIFSDPTKAWEAHDKYIDAVIKTAKSTPRAFNADHRNDDGTINETEFRLYLQGHTHVESCELDHIHSLMYKSSTYDKAIIPEGAEENDTFYLGGYQE